MFSMADRSSRHLAGHRSSAVSDFLENFVQRRDELVDVVRSDRQRRPDLQHVVGRPFGADEDARLAHPIHDVARRTRRGRPRLTIAHEIDADEQPEAAHVADHGVPSLQRAQSREQPITLHAGILLQPLLVDDAQHLGPHSARQRAPAECREELDAVVE